MKRLKLILQYSIVGIVGVSVRHIWGINAQLAMLIVLLLIWFGAITFILYCRLYVRKNIEHLSPGEVEIFLENSEPDEIEEIAAAMGNPIRDFIFDLVSIPATICVIMGPPFIYHLIRYKSFSWNDQITWQHIAIIFITVGIVVFVYHKTGSRKRDFSEPSRSAGVQKIVHPLMSDVENIEKIQFLEENMDGEIFKQEHKSKHK